MIEIDDITKTYNTTTVVDRVTLTVEPHTICVIVGVLAVLVHDGIAGIERLLAERTGLASRGEA